jgi:hypothetical protein
MSGLVIETEREEKKETILVVRVLSNTQLDCAHCTNKNKRISFKGSNDWIFHFVLGWISLLMMFETLLYNILMNRTMNMNGIFPTEFVDHDEDYDEIVVRRNCEFQWRVRRHFEY